ncbi:MAG: Tll0287-like domain-containing protein [Thiolinea sp.]
MRVNKKFNLALISLLTVGFLISGIASYYLLLNSARSEILSRAQILLDAALAARNYTVKEVRPLLTERGKDEFLPQTVPAYGATQIFRDINTKHPEYYYKEATLNPTNPRDLAVEWEKEIIDEFRASEEDTTKIGERQTLTGRSLYIARPIRIKKASCLVCHSTPEAAPKTMIELYGTKNGFNWQLNEVVGAQVVVVPLTEAVNSAQKTAFTFMGILLVIFVLIVIAANLILRRKPGAAEAEPVQTAS